MHTCRLRRSDRLKRLTLFAMVGLAGTVVHYALLLATVELIGLVPVLGSLLGSVAGALVNYLLNYRITFTSEASHVRTGTRYAVVAISCIGVNFLAIASLSTVPALDYRIAQLVATALVFLWNYALASRWVFAGDSAA